MVCDVPYVNRRDGKIFAPFPQELIALWKLRNKNTLRIAPQRIFCVAAYLAAR